MPEPMGGEPPTSTTRRVAGYEATVGTEPDAVHLELGDGRPMYIRLDVGDYLQEGDAFHRDQLGLTTPTVQTWSVVEITPTTVVGRDVETGERTEWDRATVEQELAVGTRSTNLTEFERLSIHEIRGPREGAATHPHPYTGPPYVAVVAYGDNGLKYGRRYRFVDEAAGTLELWTQDEPVAMLPDDILERLARRVTAALEADGYTVVSGE